MQKTTKAILLFKVTRFEPKWSGWPIASCGPALVIQEAVPLLREVGTNTAKISDLAEKLSRIEGETDDLYDAGRSRLYEATGPSQPIDFWVASEILGHLEKVVDRLEDVANEISGVAVEHA